MPHQAKYKLIPETPYASYAEYCEAMGGDVIERVRSLSTPDIIRELKTSQLRGRGGAGFPAWLKWDTLAHHDCLTRCVVCNAAEGEPGTFKDRYLLRKNPFSTLEGMLIAAHTIHASKIYIALKSSFKKEIQRLEFAIAEFERAGLTKGLSIQIIPGPEEYLFGEEKALLNVIEGGEPTPRESHYPPFEVGLFATPLCPNPALVNNAESYGRIATILRHGGEGFARLGTPDTHGYLIFTVCGDVAKPGVYELEAGLTLQELLDTHAGGGETRQSFCCRSLRCGFSRHSCQEFQCETRI